MSQRICIGVVVLLTAGPVLAGDADDWPGWRGVEREGRSAERLPDDWVSPECILWRTEVPGVGHSSPVVSGDRVYVTTAYIVPVAGRWLVVFRAAIAALAVAGLLGCVLLVGSGGQTMIGQERTVRAFVRSVILWTAPLGVLLAVVLGDAAFDLGRCVLRVWIASSAVVLVALPVAGMICPGRSRGRLVVGLLLIAFGIFTLPMVPAPDHAFRGGLWSANCAITVLSAVLPGALGLMLVASFLHRRFGSRWAVRTVYFLGAALALGVIGLVVYSVASITGMSRFYSAQWPWAWAVVGVVPIACGWLWRRDLLARGVRPALAVGAGVAMVLFAIWAVDRAAGLIPYLGYHLGAPRLRATGGTWSLWLAAGLVVPALAAGPSLTRTPRARRWMAHLTAVMLVAVGIGHFTVANFVESDSTFVRAIVALDRWTGRIEWTCADLPAGAPKMHRENSLATPTPVVVGDRIVAYFGTPGMLCVDTDGRKCWTRNDLPFESRYGVAGSPVACGRHVFIACESPSNNYVVAVHVDDGRLAWRASPRTTHEISAHAVSRTPCIRSIAGRTVLMVWGQRDASAYDPATGQQLWSRELRGFGYGDCVAGPVTDGRYFYLSEAKGTVAVDPQRLTSPETAPMVWRTPHHGANCVSPVVVGGRLLTLSDHGHLACLATADGRILWKTKLRGNCRCSLLADDRSVFAVSTRGIVHWFALADVCQLLGQFDLGERVFASPAPTGDVLIVRTEEAVYGIRAPMR
jgi:outer membrane protein assembly factor BamB